MKLCVLRVGRAKTGWADAAVADYRKRIRRTCTIDEDLLRPEPFRGNVDAVRTAEATRLHRRLSPRDRLIALDERGRDLDTDAFAGLLQSAQNQGVHRLVFALGGPYGHDPSTRERAHTVVRLSALVLNHEVARVVLFEQIYRGFSLLNGSPYHH